MQCQPFVRNQHSYRYACYHLCRGYQLSCQWCTPKEIDLTSIFVTIQLPYCVSMLLTSRCKLAPAQYINVVIIWRLRKIFQENKLRLY